MGMDTVELVIDIEEAFEISIPDQEAAQIMTPADLIECVCERLNMEPTMHHACLAARAFYRLRRFLVQQGGFERREIKTDTSLEYLFPRRKRRFLWQKWQSEIGVRALYLESSMMLIGGIALCSMLFALAVLHGSSAGWIALLSLGSFVVLSWLSQPLKLGFPSGIVTTGEAATLLAERVPSVLMKDTEAWSRELVAKTVRRITCEYTDEALYREDAEIVRDLGLD